MNLAEFCQQIKLLIKEIFSANKKLENKKSQCLQKVQIATITLREAVKEIAELHIKFNETNFRVTYKNNQIVWHSDFGLALRLPNGEVKPLVAESEEFPLEDLVYSIKNSLESTLKVINTKTNNVENRTNQLEKLIEILGNIENS
jgi:hypothetical protein